MNKKEALNKLKDLEKETEKLRKILENDSIDINDIDSLSDICKILNIKEEELYIFNKNTIDMFERYINACNIIPKIVKVYNQGNILDFKNSSQYKYLPYYQCSGLGWSFGSVSSWSSSSVGSSSHHYYDKELAIKACKVFNKIYIDYYSYKG